MSKNDNLWYLGRGFAGPAHSIDVLKGDDGIHRRGPQRSGGKRRLTLKYSNQTLAPLAHSESSLIQNETCVVKWNQKS